MIESCLEEHGSFPRRVTPKKTFAITLIMGNPPKHIFQILNNFEASTWVGASA